MKKNYWSLFAILTVAMLSIGFAACSNDENEIPGDDPTPQPEVVDVEPSPATITMFGKTAFTCSNAYHRTDTVIGRILHTFYFTAVDISKPWNISADYDQIAIHIETASNEELSLDTITDFTFWTKRKGGDLILKSDEPARIKFKKVNDLYSISVSDMAMYNKDYGKGDLAFTFCNTLQQFSDAEKTAASNGSYNLCFYNPIEQGAEFPGGNDMFFTWVSQNVKYPATA
ncbi:MAG: hypothetical protein IJT19_00565 [Bacteroidaceae bacterium]|nr:hypothetical protein [Bacteroidaceae bacterium]